MGIQSVLGAFVPNGAPELEVHIVLARVPRTVFGVLAGAALGMSGLLMQSITRNPIADPSILGVNTGASLFVVCGIAFFHIQSGNQYIWLSPVQHSQQFLFMDSLLSEPAVLRRFVWHWLVQLPRQHYSRW